jgi:hypothetical protein
MAKGKITLEIGALPQEHEIKTANFLASLGKDILFLKEADHAGNHTPDIKMDNLRWEMKAPKGKGKYVIQNAIQIAVKQSRNVIVDLMRIKLHQDKALHELEKEFRLSKSLKRLKIITKSKKVIDFEK